MYDVSSSVLDFFCMFTLNTDAMVLESTFILQERPRSSMKMGAEVGDMVFDVPMMDFAPGNLVRLIRERSEAKTRAVPRAEPRVVFRRESVFFGTKKSVLN